MTVLTVAALWKIDYAVNRTRIFATCIMPEQGLYALRPDPLGKLINQFNLLALVVIRESEHSENLA
jgi:hypothetical protein